MGRGAEIFTYESPSMVYAMNWSVSNIENCFLSVRMSFAFVSPQVRKDKPFRLGVGSFREESSNFVEIIHCERGASTWQCACTSHTGSSRGSSSSSGHVCAFVHDSAAPSEVLRSMCLQPFQLLPSFPFFAFSMQHFEHHNLIISHTSAASSSHPAPLPNAYPPTPNTHNPTLLCSVDEATGKLVSSPHLTFRYGGGGRGKGGEEGGKEGGEEGVLLRSGREGYCWNMFLGWG